MNSLQIECFLSVIKYNGFTEAARERYVTQPSISKQIKKLEEELGTVLFEREGKSIVLTESGKKFYDLFVEFDDRIEKLKEEAKIRKDKENFIIRFGLLQFSNLFDDFISVIDKIITAHPQFDVQVFYYNFGSLMNALKDNKVDVIMGLEEFLPSYENVQVKFVAKTNKKIIYREDIFEEDFSPKKIDDFENQRFFFTDDVWDCGDVEEHKNAFKKGIPFPFEPNLHALPNIESMIWHVAQGKGVSVVDGVFSLPETNKKIASFEIPCEHNIMLAWKTNNVSLQTSVFVDTFIEEYSRIKHNE